MIYNSDSLIGKKDNDPDWIKEIVAYIYANKKQELKKEYKILFRDLFFEYQIEGLKPKEAIEKAKKVLKCFNKINK